MLTAWEGWQGIGAGVMRRGPGTSCRWEGLVSVADGAGDNGRVLF